jgi:nucleotide sugar dehydrogenase
MKKEKIGIIGVGVVGGAVRAYFETQPVELFLHDPAKKLGSIDEVNKSDIVFICVPTPYIPKKGFDLSYVVDACKNLSGKKIVVIKSTVVPGTAEKLQKKFPQHKFLFNPEFLTEKNANQDMINPDRQIIGYTSEGKSAAKRVLDLLPKAPYQKTMPATEAEMVKYFGNTFLSLKVVFANQMYDLCDKIKIDYGQVAEAASHDTRIGKSHLEIFHEGYRGYSGKCFPKDMSALIEFSDAKGVDLKIHKLAHKINKGLLAQKVKKT